MGALRDDAEYVAAYTEKVRRFLEAMDALPAAWSRFRDGILARGIDPELVRLVDRPPVGAESMTAAAKEADPPFIVVFKDDPNYLAEVFEARWRFEKAMEELAEANPEVMGQLREMDHEWRNRLEFWGEVAVSQRELDQREQKWARLIELLKTPPVRVPNRWRGPRPATEIKTLPDLLAHLVPPLERLRETSDPKLAIWTVRNARDAWHNAGLLLADWKIEGYPEPPLEINDTAAAVLERELGRLVHWVHRQVKLEAALAAAQKLLLACSQILSAVHRSGAEATGYGPGALIRLSVGRNEWNREIHTAENYLPLCSAHNLPSIGTKTGTSYHLAAVSLGNAIADATHNELVGKFDDSAVRSHPGQAWTVDELAAQWPTIGRTVGHLENFDLDRAYDHLRAEHRLAIAELNGSMHANGKPGPSVTDWLSAIAAMDQKAALREQWIATRRDLHGCLEFLSERNFDFWIDWWEAVCRFVDMADRALLDGLVVGNELGKAGSGDTGPGGAVRAIVNAARDGATSIDLNSMVESLSAAKAQEVRLAVHALGVAFINNLRPANAAQGITPDAPEPTNAGREDVAPPKSAAQAARSQRPSWTQAAVDAEIRSHKRKNQEAYDALCQKLKTATEEVRAKLLKQARKLFGRNQVADQILHCPKAMVSGSFVWRSIADDLGLRPAKGIARTKRGIAVVESEATVGQDPTVEDVLRREAIARARNELSSEKADPIVEQLERGGSLEQAHALIDALKA